MAHCGCLFVILSLTAFASVAKTQESCGWKPEVIPGRNPVIPTLLQTALSALSLPNNGPETLHKTLADYLEKPYGVEALKKVLEALSPASPPPSGGSGSDVAPQASPIEQLIQYIPLVIKYGPQLVDAAFSPQPGGLDSTAVRFFGNVSGKQPDMEIVNHFSKPIIEAVFAAGEGGSPSLMDTIVNIMENNTHRDFVKSLVGQIVEFASSNQTLAEMVPEIINFTLTTLQDPEALTVATLLFDGLEASNFKVSWKVIECLVTSGNLFSSFSSSSSSAGGSSEASSELWDVVAAVLEYVEKYVDLKQALHLVLDTAVEVLEHPEAEQLIVDLIKKFTSSNTGGGMAGDQKPPKLTDFLPSVTADYLLQFLNSALETLFSDPALKDKLDYLIEKLTASGGDLIDLIVNIIGG